MDKIKFKFTCYPRKHNVNVSLIFPHLIQVSPHHPDSL